MIVQIIGWLCILNISIGIAAILLNAKSMTSESIRETHLNVACYLIAAAICFKGI